MLREKAWDKNLQLLLVLIIGFNVLPHIQSIPAWATSIAFIYLIWKTLTLLRGLPRPPRWILWMTSFGCTVGVFFEYHTILGQEAASALLVTLASAKLLETNRYRDAMFVIFTSFFLLMAHLLDSQTIATTIFMAVDVMLITALMFQLHKQERRHGARSFRPVMRTLGLAIPVWIFLFVVFPRFSASVWGSRESRGANSGFSENLSPGDVESLVESEEPAFRVKFIGKPPPFSDLYWRGAVLTEAKGLIWLRAKDRPNATDDVVPQRRETIVASYKAYLESRFQSWIFALDYPGTVDPSSGRRPYRHRPGFIYENERATGGVVTYEATALSVPPSQRLTDDEREKLLQLPADLDPRIGELAARFVKQARNSPASVTEPTLADRIASHAIEWFTSEHFAYTKSPGALHTASGPSQLAEFLFTTKRGFCEHYAAAFATLMRASGVPARVTIGFMGASRNDYGDYFVVRDLDAHAWTEIWRADPEKRGIGRWVRVDPTAWIAPLRVQMGGDFNLLDPSAFNSALADAENRIGSRRSRLFYKASLAWDAMQMKWNSFLADYDFEFQKSFFETFGLRNLTRWSLFGLACLGVLLFSLVMHVVLRKRAKQTDAVVLAWREFCVKLSRAGVARRSNEGPLDFTARASEKFPNRAEELHALADRYAVLRYGDAESSKAEGLRSLRRDIRRLSLK